MELPARLKRMSCGQATEQPAPLPVAASGGRRHPDGSQADKCNGVSSRKYILFILIAVVLILLLAAVIGLATALRVCNSGGPRCPDDWIGYGGKCYYISEKEANWTSSQRFCSAHGANLAIIKDEEKVFVSQNTANRPSWIGLCRVPGQPWKWLNGETSWLDVLGDGGNCAYLNDEGKASSSRCNTEHHWICSKSCDA